MNTNAKTQNSRPGFSTGDHWLRGGQVLGHTWDMIIEVLRKFSIPAVIAGFLLFNQVNHSATQQQQTLGYQAGFVWIYKVIGPPMPRSISVINGGASYVVTIEQFDHTDWVQASVKRYQFLLMMAGMVWTLGLVALWCILSVIFVKRGKSKIDDYAIRGQKLARLSKLLPLLFTYNADQVRKLNIATLERMDINDHPPKASGELLRAITYPCAYAAIWIKDYVDSFIDMIVWPFAFLSNLTSKTEQSADSAPSSKPILFGARFVLASRKTSQETERKEARRSSFDRGLRAYIHTLKPQEKLPAHVVQSNPRSVYDALREEGWATGNSTPYNAKLLASVGKYAAEHDQTFYAKPSDFMPPKILNIPYPFESERQHTLVVGGTGSGKTVLINTLIDSIKERGDKAIIYDSQGDFTKYHYREGFDKILNPFDKRSVAWSPFNDTTTKEDWYSAAEDLFEDGSSDPYWTEVPREIYSRVGHATLLLYREYHKRLPTVMEFVRILNGPHHIIYGLIENTSAARALGEREGNRSDSLRSVIAKVTARMEHLVNKEADFSMKAWINDPKEHGLLFITAPEDVATALMPLISHWCSLATTAMLSRDDEQSKQPTWIILDEFPNLKIPVLAKSTALLRKFNGRMVIGMQQFSQLVYNYGEDLANTILGQMSNRIILRLNDAISARFFSDEIGSVEKSIKDESTSFGASNIRDGVSITSRDQIVKIALPEELQGLPTFQGYLRFSPGNQAEPFPWVMVKYEPTKRDVIAERCDRIVRHESIFDYLPQASKAYELNDTIGEFIGTSSKTDIGNAQNSAAQLLAGDAATPATDGSQSSATTDADAKAGAARPDREYQAGEGDAAVAPLNPETNEHAHEDIKNLGDRATKEELAKVNDKMALKLAKENMTSGEVANDLFNMIMGGQSSAPTTAQAVMAIENGIVSKMNPEKSQGELSGRGKNGQKDVNKDNDEGLSK